LSSSSLPLQLAVDRGLLRGKLASGFFELLLSGLQPPLLLVERGDRKHARRGRVLGLARRGTLWRGIALGPDRLELHHVALAGRMVTFVTAFLCGIRL
jgi:hypothetical protein